MTLTSSIPGGRANFFLSRGGEMPGGVAACIYTCIYIIYTRYVYESVSTDLS